MAIAMLAMNANAKKILCKSPAQGLIERLQTLQKRGVMFGHQDALFYGTTWKWEFGRSDVNDVCGDYPAVLGCELGGLELGNDKNLDGVPFDKMRQQIIAHHQQGGIVTISWHPYNPVTGKDAWNTEGDAVTAVLPGGKEAGKMQLWHKRMADFMASLKDEKGRAVPRDGRCLVLVGKQTMHARTIQGAVPSHVRRYGTSRLTQPCLELFAQCTSQRHARTLFSFLLRR